MGIGFRFLKTMAALIIAASTAFSWVDYTYYGDGTLVLYGIGDMPNWSKFEDVPWYGMRITKVEFEGNITSIGDYAFYMCKDLASIDIPNSVTKIGNYAFAYCDKLTAAVIPNSVTVIGEVAFLGCNKLTTMVVPNSVTKIDNYAFAYCSKLVSINIPNSLTEIGDAAFMGCVGLKQVINESLNPQAITFSTFGGVDVTKVKLYVDGAALNDYKNAHVWQDFFAIADVKTLFTLNDLTLAVGESQTLKAQFDIAALTLFLQGFIGDLTLTWSSGDENIASVTPAAIDAGRVTGISTGTATITVTLKSVGLSSSCVATVVRKQVAKPVMTNYQLVYTGSRKYAVMTNFDYWSSYYSYEETWGTDAGDYVAKIALLDKKNCEWEDGTDDDLLLPWSIAKAKVEKPFVVNTELVYTGHEQSAGIAEGEKYTLIGDTKGTNAGDYIAAGVLNDKNNYEWEDGSGDDVVLPWIIARAEGVFGKPAPINTIYTPTLTLGDLTLPAGYTWTEPSTSLSVAKSGWSFEALFVHPSGNYEVKGEIVVNVAKAQPDMLSPIDTVYSAALKLSDLLLPVGYTWNTPATHLEAGKNQRFIVTFMDWEGNYITTSGDVVVNVAKAKIVKPFVVNTALVYTGKEQSAGITANAAVYTVTGDKGTNAGDYAASVVLNDKDNYEWSDGTGADLALSWKIAKKAGTFIDIDTINTKYTPTLTLGDLTLPDDYVWVAAKTVLNAGDEQKFLATYTDPSGNYTSVNGYAVINVAKAKMSFESPDTITTIYSPLLTLGDLSLPDDYVWYNPDTLLNVGNRQEFAAVYTDPSGNYEAVAGKVVVNVDAINPNGVLLKESIVSDKAEFWVVLPGDRVVEVRAVILDKLGNVLYDEKKSGDKSFFWNLTNLQGRQVGSGTYLIVARVKGDNGSYVYKTKVGVKR